jgi:hypothetical protein
MALRGAAVGGRRCAAASGHVPQPHRAIFAAGGQGLAVRAERHREDRAGVPGERLADLAVGAGGAWASAGDLIVARENDHQLVTDPGHTLANGDRFVVDAVTSEGLFVRRVLEDKQLAERPVLYPAAKLAATELGYAVTGHTGQGGTVTRGEAVFGGNEPREWAYVALTRGRERNAARVITQARAADPGAGTQADPELARADLLRRERAGLPVGAEQQEPGVREPMAVLADCLDRGAGEESATEYQRKSLVRADHLGLLHARWAD